MNRKIISILVIVLIAGAIFYLESLRVTPERSATVDSDIPLSTVNLGDNLSEEDSAMSDQVSATPPAAPVINNRIKAKLDKYGRAKEITTPDGFINTAAINLTELIGKKVILIDFWTYSCINCQRTTPYLNAWYEKYKDQGLEIVGIHTPEFEFEKKYENVLRAVEQFNIKFPVALDNDFSTWFAYNNRYWPRKYLIDIDGFIVYDHIGEGSYAETELKIQDALTERMKVLGENIKINRTIVDPRNVERIEGGKAYSPEIYFGAARNQLLGSGSSGKTGRFSFDQPNEVLPNVLYLVGDWEITSEYAEAKSRDARIIFKYQAAKVFMVAGAAKPTGARVLKDSQVVGRDGLINIQAEQLYRLIEDDYGQHILEVIFTEPGAQVFTFTFG
jgi:thiol-disulfide isomerase/thioredoxin